VFHDGKVGAVNLCSE